MSLQQQWLTAVWMLFAGGMLGLAFDGSRAICDQFRILRAINWLIDIFYWLAATPFLFIVLVAVNEGRLNIYVFLFLFVGAILYFHFISSRMYKFMVSLITIIKRIGHIVYAIVLRPWVRLFLFLFKFVAQRLRAGWQKAWTRTDHSKTED